MNDAQLRQWGRILSSYPKPKSGEWIDLDPAGYKFRCCDCKLVHVLKFRAQNTKFVPFIIEMSVERDNRATAASRRKRR